MRAHQTHRVLLNTPIFKEMTFGDVKGKEPTTKSVTFAVADEEKLTPYTLKVCVPSVRHMSFQVLTCHTAK